MFSSNTDSLGYQSFKGASWALVLGMPLRDTIKGLLLVLGSFLIPMFGLARLLFQTPSLIMPNFYYFQGLANSLGSNRLILRLVPSKIEYLLCFLQFH